jgi:Tfp pilus assembly pilus retraction ATPase PilT
VTAAEMGILVMGTLHTNGAAQTVDRMVNVFPSDKQSHVRTMDNAIEQLLKERTITGKEAYKKGISKAKFEPVKDQG